MSVLNYLNYKKMASKKTDHIAQENELTRLKFELESILEFTKNNKVEVMLEQDLQYSCFVNYKEGDRPYGSGLTPLWAMIDGINKYKEHGRKTA